MSDDGPLSFDEAMRQIRRLVNQGCTVPWYHADRRGRERNIDDADVMNVLTYGSVTNATGERNNWRYEVTGEDLEGEPTRCIVIIDDDLYIVTVI